MAFTPCDFCTGSRWLQDAPILGPCLCVTPDNLREANEEIHDLSEEGLDETAAAFRDHLQKYLVAQGLDPMAVRYDDPNLDAAMDLLAAWR